MWVRVTMAVFAATALLAVPGVASAHEEEVSVSPGQALPGQVITVAGTGFGAGGEISIHFEGDHHSAGRTQVASDGSFSVAIAVPEDLASGPRAIVVTAGREEFTAPFRVLAPGAPQPPSMEPSTLVATGLIGVLPSVSEAAEAVVEGTIAALLPILWLILVAVHLARPYMVQNLEKFTLRLGADLWWLAYRGTRDLLLVITFMLSSIFFLPHVAEMVALPLSGPVAGVAAFAALLAKLMRDSDGDYRAFVLESSLLAGGGAIYWFGFFLGPAMSAMADGGPVPAVSRALTTTTNLDTAVAMTYLSLVAVAAMGFYAVYYNLRLTGTPTGEAR